MYSSQPRINLKQRDGVIRKRDKKIEMLCIPVKWVALIKAATYVNDLSRFA